MSPVAAPELDRVVAGRPARLAAYRRAALGSNHSRPASIGGPRRSGRWFCLGQQGGRHLHVGLRERVYRVRGPLGLNDVQDLGLRQPLRVRG